MLQKQGLEATGILAGVAKTAGFGSVSELLEKNPTARSLSMLAPAAKPGRPESAPKRVKKERTPTAELVDDATLGAFPPHVVGGGRQLGMEKRLLEGFGLLIVCPPDPFVTRALAGIFAAVLASAVQDARRKAGPAGCGCHGRLPRHAAGDSRVCRGVAVRNGLVDGRALSTLLPQDF